MSFATALDGSAPGLVFGLDLAAKVTILLVVGLIVQHALARWKASLGTTAGNACLIGLLLLPLSVSTLPTFAVPCLPAANSRTRPQADAREVTGPASITPVVPGEAFSSEGRFRSATRPDRCTKYERISTSRSGDTASSPGVNHAVPPLVASTTARTFDWRALAFLGYAIVTLALLVRLLASHLAVSRLRVGTTSLVDGAWWLALERWRQRLGIKRSVELAWSREVSVPLVLGWAKPVVVLPSSIAEMSTSVHADAVLLHELAHVRRGDYSWNVLLRLVQAVYWPHPLVWFLGRAIAEDAQTRLRRFVYS